MLLGAIREQLLKESQSTTNLLDKSMQVTGGRLRIIMNETDSERNAMNDNCTQLMKKAKKQMGNRIADDAKTQLQHAARSFW